MKTKPKILTLLGIFWLAGVGQAVQAENLKFDLAIQWKQCANLNGSISCGGIESLPEYSPITLPMKGYRYAEMEVEQGEYREDFFVGPRECGRNASFKVVVRRIHRVVKPQYEMLAALKSDKGEVRAANQASDLSGLGIHEELMHSFPRHCGSTGASQQIWLPFVHVRPALR